MGMNDKEKQEKQIKSIQFAKAIDGSLKKVNNYTGIQAAVRSMIDGGRVKTNFLSDEYLEEDGTSNE